MKHLPSPPLRIFALTGLLSLSAIGASTYGHEAAQQRTAPCAAAASGSSSSSSAAASGTGARVSAGTGVVDRQSPATARCGGVPCLPSTGVNSGSGGLSGSTTMPDGSSVTVHSGGGVVSSSSGSKGSSNQAHGASASARSGQGADCAVTTEQDRDAMQRNKQESHPTEQRRQ